MVKLIALLQPTQDGHGILHRRLVHFHGLKTSLQGRILFHMPAVFIQRSRPNRVQLATSELGFEQVGGVDRPFTASRSHDRVSRQ